MTAPTEETREFLNKLFHATKEGKLSWEADSRTAFAVRTVEGDVSLRSRDNDDRHPFILSITNRSEVPVIDLTTGLGDLPEGYDAGIYDLYRMVKDRALGISSTLDSISKELDI